MNNDPVKCCTLYKDEGMGIDYESEYTALVKLVDEHNKSCDSECRSRAKYCVDDLAISRNCNDCPKFYKVYF